LKRIAALISPNITLYAKFDGLNPTGSFKDRGMTLAVSLALEEGRETMMCASTGNTSASAAAYAARAGMRCFVLIPDGKVALGKLSQAVIHGATVISIRGNFDAALALVRDICSTHSIALVNSVNPFRIEGQKTAAFEVVDAMGDAPDYHALPVGNAGNITAYWMGYKQYYDKKMSARLPKMLGFQASGAAPIVSGSRVDNPETIATAIRIGNPASWSGAVSAISESGGHISSVTDDEILSAYSRIAEMEGLFVEPASAAPIAGLIKLGGLGWFKESASIVVTLTGHGLKDPETAVNSVHNSRPSDPVPARKEDVLKAIGFD
jgi:threonine synthase